MQVETELLRLLVQIYSFVVYCKKKAVGTDSFLNTGLFIE